MEKITVLKKSNNNSPKHGAGLPSPTFRQPKSGAGFTLIELLAVIGIIGLLASVALVALNSARQKSRNAKRKDDIRQIRSVLEMYYGDNQDTYPNGGALGTPNRESDIQNLSGFLAPKYLLFLPNDPKNSPDNYQYIWWNGGKDYGIFIPFANDNGANCQFQTPGGNKNWFKNGPLETPLCDYQN